MEAEPGAAYSKPVGYITQAVRGKATASSPDVFNLFGIQLQDSGLKSGSFTSIGTSEITDSNADFSDLPNEVVLLEIKSGTLAGVIQEVSTFGTNTIAVPESLVSSGLAVGDEYRVRKLPTIEGIFGLASQTTLTAGSVVTADIVWISNGTGGFDRYYVSPANPPLAPAAVWVKIGGSRGVGSTPVVHTDAVLVQRRSVGNLNLTFTGEVKTDLSKFAVLGAAAGPTFNYIGSPFPSELSGSNPVSNVDTTVGASGVLSVLSPGSIATADVLWLPKEDGSYRRFYLAPAQPPLRPNQTFNEIGGASNVDSNSIKLTSAFIIQRKSMGMTTLTFAPPAGFTDL